MQEKQQLKKKEQSGIRHKIMEVQYMIMTSFQGPHQILQTIFQILMYFQLLKFSIDYFSKEWFGSYQPIISYTDPSYIVRSNIPQLWSYFFYLIIGIMGLYIILLISLFRPFSASFTKASCIILKTLFLIFGTFGLMPTVGFVFHLNSCNIENQNIFWPCNKLQSQNNISMILGFSISGVFILILCIQSMLRFDFIYKKQKTKVIKDSSYTTTLILVYIILNEIINQFMQGNISAIVLSISFALITLTFVLKDQHQNQIFKRIQVACILVNIAAIILADCKVFFQAPLEFHFFLFITIPLIFSALQFQFFGIKFQIQNVNKWSTSVLRIKYTRGLNMLCRRVIEGSFQHICYIYGYVDVHRQKCQISGCPFRRPSEQFKDKKPEKCQIQLSLELKRSYGLIKKIYSDGCKISPVNPQLQLNYSIFLQEIGQRDLALRNLLMMNYDELSFQNYYKFCMLKKKIYGQICQQTQKQFLDLVSQLQVKRMQTQLMKRFEQAALINLQFWSVLNQDHPDFQKLNDIGVNLIKINNQVRKNYEDICKYAHNQRITGIYIHYLTSIQNDQSPYNDLNLQTKEKYKLKEKIVLQDWSNNSQPILLVSIQESNYGSIIDINSTCASMLGYEKYQLVNRNCKVLFKQQIRSQLSKFLAIRQKNNRFFYLIHKNGYLIKIKRKIQNYNSMETGMTLIITIQFTVLPYTTFFLAESTNKKIVGTASSTISIFGIQNKVFESISTLTDLLKPSIQKIRQINQNGNCLMKYIDLFSDQFKGASDTKQKALEGDQFSVNILQVDQQLISLQLTLIKQKLPYKGNKQENANFQFVIEATLTDFKYVCETNQGNSYLRQFSQLSFHSDVARAQSYKNYAEKISTLRLVDNIIQVIQDNDVFDDSKQKNNITQNEQFLMQKIARKDEQKIFQNKESYTEFVRKQRITMCLPWILAIGLILSVAFYGVCLSIYQVQNKSTQSYFSQMNYQNRVIGTLAKQQSFMQNYRAHSLLKSQRSLNLIPQRYYQNAKQLQKIRLNGSSPFKIPVYINQNVTSQFLSDQFLLSYSNNALDFISKIEGAQTSQQVQTIYNQIDPFLIFFLIKNGQTARQFMQNKLKERQIEIIGQFNKQILKQIIILVSGVSFQLIFAIILFIIIWKIHNQKINLLKIFLQITELQIMKFSAKTQKFLISLHMEQSNQIDVSQENQGKKTSGTFAKKKRFKVIKMDKCVYFKFLIIPIIAKIFFLHTFMISFQNLNFMKDSITYIRYSASGDLVFYKGLTVLQKEFLGGPPQPDISIQFLQYYRRYFDSHYITFGNIPTFQEYFTNIFMKNTCNGTVTVPQSCQAGKILKLASNGSLMIFTDITVQTEERYGKVDFNDLYYTQYEIMSDTHRQLTQQVVIEQKKVIASVQSELLNAFLIWIFCLLGVGILYGGPMIRKFLDEINYNKDMITILPISIAKQSAQVNYFMKDFLSKQ